MKIKNINKQYISDIIYKTDRLYHKSVSNNILYSILKRVFDITFASIAIILSAPIMLVVAILIKIKSPEGGILFKQKRVGLNGKIFEIYKFRTMIPNAQNILKELLDKDEELKKEYLTHRKLKNDPRIIPFVGKFLRKTGLDELPQFFNILKGDMSVVGPRPYMVEEIIYRRDKYYLTSVKPGITGYWQTLPNRHDTTLEERIEIEKEYIANRSILLDLKIIFKTVAIMVGQKGL